MAGLWYRVGTVSVTNGSKKVTGFGTQWKSTVYKPDKGHAFYGPDGKAYEIDYVESDTVLYLVMVYAGATANTQPYAIDITRTSTIPAFSRELSAFTAYAQSQYDSWQHVLTGTGSVTLTAPDGQQIQVPALSSMQPSSASLKALQALTPAVDKLPFFSGSNAAALTALTAFARTLLDDANAPAALSTLDIADLYKRRNILGAVSQSGGIPTGAVLERGSNSNGEYARLADGTVIAWAVSSPVVTSAPTDGVNSANITWTYPVEVLTPVLLAAVSASGRVMWSPGHPTVSSTAGSIYISSMTPFSGLTVACRRMVVGRWY